jgi:hypothetical protein
MAKGGKREGAGRKPGTPNKATQEQRDAIAASGLTPLEYMLQVMRDEAADETRRLEAAKSAAPFCHARLSAVELSGSVATVTHEEWLASLQ